MTIGTLNESPRPRLRVSSRSGAGTLLALASALAIAACGGSSHPSASSPPPLETASTQTAQTSASPGVPAHTSSPGSQSAHKSASAPHKSVPAPPVPHPAVTASSTHTAAAPESPPRSTQPVTRRTPTTITPAARAALLRHAQLVAKYAGESQPTEIRAVLTTHGRVSQAHYGRPSSLSPSQPVYFVAMRGHFSCAHCGAGASSAQGPVLMFELPLSFTPHAYALANAYPELQALGKPTAL
jgi:hypothetical protein